MFFPLLFKEQHMILMLSLFFIFCSPSWRNTLRDYDICRYVQYNLICFKCLKCFRFISGQSSFLEWPAWLDRQRPTALASCIWSRLCSSSLRVRYMHSILVQCPDWLLGKFLVERDLSVSVPYWLLSLAYIQLFFPIRPTRVILSPKAHSICIPYTENPGNPVLAGPRHPGYSGKARE